MRASSPWQGSASWEKRPYTPLIGEELSSDASPPARSCSFRRVIRSMYAGESPGSGAWRLFRRGFSESSGGRGCFCLCGVVVVGVVGMGGVVGGGLRFQ